jgi:hypothetical protein
VVLGDLKLGVVATLCVREYAVLGLFVPKLSHLVDVETELVDHKLFAAKLASVVAYVIHFDHSYPFCF